MNGKQMNDDYPILFFRIMYLCSFSTLLMACVYMYVFSDTEFFFLLIWYIPLRSRSPFPRKPDTNNYKKHAFTIHTHANLREHLQFFLSFFLSGQFCLAVVVHVVNTHYINLLNSLLWTTGSLVFGMACLVFRSRVV